jgi:hypothetical protein
MELFCEFFTSHSFLTNTSTYICKVSEINRIASNGRVFNITGTHIDDKSHADVDSIYFSDLNLVNFPRYLCKFFPNLKSISIIGCNVRSLTKFDLIGCEEIEKIMMNGNKISSLNDDVFEFAPNIESLSFFDNQINFISGKIFDKMENLSYVNFKMNPGIDVCCKQHGSGLKSLAKLKEAIRAKWHGVKVENGNLKLVETFQFLENFVASSEVLIDDKNIN